MAVSVNHSYGATNTETQNEQAAVMEPVPGTDVLAEVVEGPDASCCGGQVLRPVMIGEDAQQRAEAGEKLLVDS